MSCHFVRVPANFSWLVWLRKFLWVGLNGQFILEKDGWAFYYYATQVGKCSCVNNNFISNLHYFVYMTMWNITELVLCIRDHWYSLSVIKWRHKEFFQKNVKQSMTSRPKIVPEFFKYKNRNTVDNTQNFRHLYYPNSDFIKTISHILKILKIFNLINKKTFSLYKTLVSKEQRPC